GTESGADAAGGGPDQQRVADIEGAQPDRQLAEQDDCRLARQDPVAPPVTGHGPDDQPEDAVHAAGDHPRQLAPGFARHYDGSAHACYRAEHEQRSGRRRDITCRDRGCHQLSLVNILHSRVSVSRGVYSAEVVGVFSLGGLRQPRRGWTTPPAPSPPLNLLVYRTRSVPRRACKRICQRDAAEPAGPRETNRMPGDAGPAFTELAVT